MSRMFTECQLDIMADAVEFRPGTRVEPNTLVELSVSCRKLIDTDIFSRSHPNASMRGWKEFGRTEIIWNNLNPDFVKKFVLQYFFEQLQKLKFEVYNINSESPDLTKHDILCQAECTLGEVVSANRLLKKLTGSKKECGSIIIGAEELSNCKEQATFQFQGLKLDKKDFFGKSDPFLTFSRSNEDGRTEVIKKTLNPTWKPLTISVRSLCNGDYDRCIQVECFDWNADGRHEQIGVFGTTLRELSRGVGDHNKYACINAKLRQKRGNKYQNSGMVELLSFKIENVFSFLDYISGGTQIHCVFAVDFTASNGDPNTLTSLHYLNPCRPNPYATAIQSVGNIIQDYDSDNLFPALGFGARLPPNGIVSHEFALNGDPHNPYCQGVSGVLEAYHKTLRAVQLYGPTNFAPCIRHVARFAEAASGGDDYFILLIITDGIITDMEQTKDAIVNGSSLPLSIVIVGVGDADFEAMNILDGDNQRLSYRGRYAERDIVQFVPMHSFIGRGGGESVAIQACLAKEVLEEIPAQFLSYMQKHNVKPKPPLQRQLAISSIGSLPATEQ